MNKKYDAIALFSGGLDSILAVKMLEEQGLNIKCLHFVTPFFGNADMVHEWQKKYNLDIDSINIGEDFAQMLIAQPAHGFGKWLNPCVDCKILMLTKTREYIQKYNVSCVVSGEVIGQRPMSQRRDTLNVIRRDSGLGDVLLRPLSALLLEPSKAELSGLVDRSRLGKISGRGRKDQLKLAARYGIVDIPTPAGGCLLAEQENASRYAKIMIYIQNPCANDFELAQSGRQFWAHEEHGAYWLCIGRDAESNAKLDGVKRPSDIIFKLRDFAGPLAVARPIDEWHLDMIKDAAAFMASFSPRAVRSAASVVVNVRQDGRSFEVEVLPERNTKHWFEPKWDESKKILKTEIN